MLKQNILLFLNYIKNKNYITSSDILIKIFRLLKSNQKIFYFNLSKNSVMRIFFSRYCYDKKIKFKSNLDHNYFAKITVVYKSWNSKFHNKVNNRYYYYNDDKSFKYYEESRFTKYKTFIDYKPKQLLNLINNPFIESGKGAKKRFEKLIGFLPY